MKVIWSPLALERVVEIANYIGRDNPQAAERWAKKLFSSTDILKRFPQRGRQVPETHRPDIREIILPPYRVIYRLRKDHVTVLTVRHERQRLARLEIV